MKMKIRSIFVSVVAVFSFHAILYFLMSKQSEKIVEIGMKRSSLQTVPQKLHFGTFYAIFSAPSETEQRSAWRTEGLWSTRCLEQFSKNNISLVYRFVVGHEAEYDLELVLERERYNDLIILDMHDGYRNLTCKLGTLMEWSTFDCPFTFDTMLRMDIDVFPNPFHVQEYAGTLPPMTVSGHVSSQSPVIRDMNHRWHDIDYPLDNYFPYSSGGSYFITKDVVNYLGREHRQGLLRYYANEDVTMGTWIAGRTISLIHDPRIMSIDCTDDMITSTDFISKERHIDWSANLYVCENPCQCY